jgi:hypothetical protein
MSKSSVENHQEEEKRFCGAENRGTSVNLSGPGICVSKALAQFGSQGSSSQNLSFS